MKAIKLPMKCDISRDRYATRYTWKFPNNDSFNANENFIVRHSLLTTEGDRIVAVIKYVLLRINLCIEDTCVLCYDGASIMSGSNSRVATQLKLFDRKCLYTQCYRHALNLAVGDAIKSVGFLECIFDTAHEMCKLIKLSPRRNNKLNGIQIDAKMLQKVFMSYAQPDGLFEKNRFNLQSTLYFWVC